VEKAAGALDAEIGAVVAGDAVHGLFGFGDAAPPPASELLVGDDDGLWVAGVGQMHRVVVELGSELPGALLIARVEGAFDAEERQMLLGMARILGLRLQGLRTLAAERQRKRLLETLLAIQRTISHRAPLQEVLDSITRSASELLGGAPVALVLTEPLEPGHPIVSSTLGPKEAGLRPGILAAATLAMVEGRTARGDAEVRAVAVHVRGAVCGALVTDSCPDGAHQGVLAAFAEQASAALTDASTLKAVSEARRDSLTGLPNRALFLEHLTQTLGSVGPSRDGPVLLFIDLDGFKAVNDSFGHDAGDQLLAAVAGRLRGCLRPTDMAARLGGDEFAILLSGPCGVVDGVGAAVRMIAELQRPIGIRGRDVWISASVGVAQASQPSASATAVLSDADIAMYKAKGRGRGQIVVFEPSMRDELLGRHQLETDLQQGFNNGEFYLHYQPIVRLADGSPAAVEVLARWTHPDRGPIEPRDFIDIAEHTGMINELGRWVLKESCRQVARWRATISPSLTLNLNVSGRQLDSRFVRDVQDALEATGLPARALVLEITETVFVENHPEMLSVLGDLISAGVRASVDDFGTGYSSLSSLRRFPIDQLKIDKSLVDPIVEESEDLAIVSTIVTLGAILDTETVAEGVETPAQAEQLRAVGCVYAQGYHFCRPGPAERIEAYLASWTGD